MPPTIARTYGLLSEDADMTRNALSNANEPGKKKTRSGKGKPLKVFTIAKNVKLAKIQGWMELYQLGGQNPKLRQDLPRNANTTGANKEKGEGLCLQSVLDYLWAKSDQLESTKPKSIKDEKLALKAMYQSPEYQTKGKSGISHSANRSLKPQFTETEEDRSLLEMILTLYVTNNLREKDMLGNGDYKQLAKHFYHDRKFKLRSDGPNLLTDPFLIKVRGETEYRRMEKISDYTTTSNTEDVQNGHITLPTMYNAFFQNENKIRDNADEMLLARARSIIGLERAATDKKKKAKADAKSKRNKKAKTSESDHEDDTTVDTRATNVTRDTETGAYTISNVTNDAYNNALAKATKKHGFNIDSKDLAEFGKTLLSCLGYRGDGEDHLDTNDDRNSGKIPGGFVASSTKKYDELGDALKEAYQISKSKAGGKQAALTKNEKNVFKDGVIEEDITSVGKAIKRKIVIYSYNSKTNKFKKVTYNKKEEICVHLLKCKEKNEDDDTYADVIDADVIDVYRVLLEK